MFLNNSNLAKYTADVIMYHLFHCCSGVFFNKGENCIAASRLFVEETINDEYVERVVSIGLAGASLTCALVYVL